MQGPQAGRAPRPLRRHSGEHPWRRPPHRQPPAPAHVWVQDKPTGDTGYSLASWALPRPAQASRWHRGPALPRTGCSGSAQHPILHAFWGQEMPRRQNFTVEQGTPQSLQCNPSLIHPSTHSFIFPPIHSSQSLCQSLSLQCLTITPLPPGPPNHR